MQSSKASKINLYLSVCISWCMFFTWPSKLIQIPLKTCHPTKKNTQDMPLYMWKTFTLFHLASHISITSIQRTPWNINHLNHLPNPYFVHLLNLCFIFFFFQNLTVQFFTFLTQILTRSSTAGLNKFPMRQSDILRPADRNLGAPLQIAPYYGRVLDTPSSVHRSLPSTS